MPRAPPTTTYHHPAIHCCILNSARWVPYTASTPLSSRTCAYTPPAFRFSTSTGASAVHPPTVVSGPLSTRSASYYVYQSSQHTAQHYSCGTPDFADFADIAKSHPDSAACHDDPAKVIIACIAVAQVRILVWVQQKLAVLVGGYLVTGRFEVSIRLATTVLLKAGHCTVVTERNMTG